MHNSTVDELKTLAIESRSPEAVDVLSLIEDKAINTTQAIDSINAFANVLVADGTLTISDASKLLEEANQPGHGVQWTDFDPDALYDED